MPPRPHGRPRGALEREVLACLAAGGRPLTPGEVRAELGDQLAYTTIMTTLSRLHAKGAVARRPSGRGFAYELAGEPADAEASMTAHRMLQLLQGGQDRAGVLSRFVADLSPEDEELLAGLLGEEPRTGPHDQPGPHGQPGPGDR